MLAALASPVAVPPVHPRFPGSSRLLGQWPFRPRSHAPPDAYLDISPHGESCGIAGAWVGRRGAKAATTADPPALRQAPWRWVSPERPCLFKTHPDVNGLRIVVAPRQ